jgi:23S rRNA pseudoU1915 N3-methylase RlmH
LFVLHWLRLFGRGSYRNSKVRKDIFRKERLMKPETREKILRKEKTVSQEISTRSSFVLNRLDENELYPGAIVTVDISGKTLSNDEIAELLDEFTDKLREKMLQSLASL